jgi:hypothetical protein
MLIRSFVQNTESESKEWRTSLPVRMFNLGKKSEFCIMGRLTTSIIRLPITLTIQAASTSVTSANSYKTTRRNIREDNHLHSKPYLKTSNQNERYLNIG